MPSPVSYEAGGGMGLQGNRDLQRVDGKEGAEERAGSLGALPYGFLLQEHSAATEAKLAPQAHKWPTPSNHTPNYAVIQLV